jgi:hypothetical protein
MNMKKWALRTTTVVFAFVAGIITTQISHSITLDIPKAEQRNESKLCTESLRQNSQTPKTTPTPPMMKYSSPYEIEYSIRMNPQANLQMMWMYWGIGTTVKGFGHTMSKGFIDSCEYSCEVATYEYDFDSDGETETLLQIQNEPRRISRFMLFKRSRVGDETIWKLLGHIDNDYCKYAMPTPLIFGSGGKTWLVISRNQGASGSGVHTFYDCVYEVSDNGLDEVLSYTSDGHQGGGYEEGTMPNRQFSATISNYEKKNGSEFVTVDYKVWYGAWNYFGQPNTLSLWSKNQKAVYRRDNPSSAFVLDVSKSALTEKEIEEVYNIDSLFEESFIRYNYNELTGIAKGNDERKKEWLRKYLENCENVPHDLKSLMK